MTFSISRTLMLVAALAVIASFAKNASAVSIETDNWRFIYMNQVYFNGYSSENFGYYSGHTNNQENTVFHFDVSPYAGGTAGGDGQVVLTYNASGFSPGPVSLVQLNAFNADVNLDSAGSFYKDSPDANPGTLQWINNSGTPLANLNFNSAVYNIGTLISTEATPSVISDGDTLSFTIPQATIQAWLDGTLPSTVILTADVYGPASIGYFKTTAGDLAELTFDVGAVPEPSSFALAALGLAGLGWFGIRRRRG